MVRSILVAAALMMAAACETPTVDPVSRGRALTDWSSPQSLESLAKAASPQLKALIVKSGGPTRFSQTLAAQLGAEQQVFDELALTLNGRTTYQRLACYDRVPAALTSAAWTQEGQVLAAGVAPAPPPLPPGGPTAKTPLSLPFAQAGQGHWFTYWGGDNAARNHHVGAPDQRHAYDLLVVREGRTFEGAKERNESYFCWGEPILAPAAGRVVAVVDGIADNVPAATTNIEQPAGNHVIIEHRPGEFSLLGHLRRGSTAVTRGQAVALGQRVGACGNSGNSSEPHLHFHVQTAGAFGQGQGLRAPFRNYLADGRKVALGEPVRGQALGVPTPPPPAP